MRQLWKLLPALLFLLCATPASAAGLATGQGLSVEARAPSTSVHAVGTTPQGLMSPHSTLDLSLRPQARRQAETRTPEELGRDLRLRRKLVEAHQILSVILMPVMGAAITVGQINAASILSGNFPPFEAYAAHRVLQAVSQGLYWTAGAVAWIAPPAIRRAQTGRQLRADSGNAHAVLSILHGICMGGVLATGLVMANANISGNAYTGVLGTHLGLGWAAFGLTTAAGIAILAF